MSNLYTVTTKARVILPEVHISEENSIGSKKHAFKSPLYVGPFCSICLTPYESDEPEHRLTDFELGITKCNHVFCKTCIDEWVQRNPTCPECRELLVNRQVRSIDTPRWLLLAQILLWLHQRFAVSS